MPSLSVVKLPLKNRFSSVALAFLLFAALSTAIRLLLLARAWANVDAEPLLLAKIFGVGFFYDCVTFSFIAIPYVLLSTLLPDKVFNARVFRAGSLFVFFIGMYLLLFDAAAEYFFFEEFGTRFNFIAIDYLVYTTEVIKNIRESYPIDRILVGIFLLAALIFFVVRKPLSGAYRHASTFRNRILPGSLLLMVPLVSYVFVDTSLEQISRNNYANELSANGIYNLAAAFRNNELNYEGFYATRDDSVVFGRLRHLLREKDSRFTDAYVRDITREVVHPGPEKRLNVILVTEESMSAEFLGAFGNKEGLTPNMDRLAGESMFFTRLYATGTRTVRGLEAITLSLPPLPGTSVIKRPDNANLFSFGSLMREKGYDNRFLYAGYGYFDDMNSFFAGNGFTVVDRGDFSKEEVTFSNAWGVCDEDLFAKVIKEADKSHAAGSPFFYVVMTTSNHRPFTYPGGKIDIPSGAGRSGAVKYADYAIGKFLEQASREPWFRDTLFVFVADHCAGSAGKTDLPVEEYHIPLIVYSPAHVRPRRVDTLASQIDIAPTVLGILNFSYRTKFLGRNILETGPTEERVFLSTYQKLGFLRGETLTILSPKKGIEAFDVAKGDARPLAVTPPESDVTDAIAYYQGTQFLYRHRHDRPRP